jgi:hypothetical protein
VRSSTDRLGTTVGEGPLLHRREREAGFTHPPVVAERWKPETSTAAAASRAEPVMRGLGR